MNDETEQGIREKQEKEGAVITVILKSVMIIFMLLGGGFAAVFLQYREVSPDTVIYRVSQDKVMFEFTFWDWTRARGHHPDYKKIIFNQDPDIADMVDNIAYHAQFKFIGDEKLVRSYLEEGDNPQTDLYWSTRNCVISVARWSTKVKHHPDLEARALSISDMNTHCPMTNYGYEWAGTLEIVQCYPYPDDVAMRNKCLIMARDIPTY
jgi:hypothetical protein